MLCRASFHYSGGTCRYAKFTDAAFFLVKLDNHFRPSDGKGTGRTNCRTCPAVVTFFLFPSHFLFCIFDLHPLIFEIFYPLSEIFSASVKLKNQGPLFPGKHSCIEYIKGKIIISDQGADKGLVDDSF